MNFTHAVYLMSGDIITITEKQFEAIKAELINGAEWVPIGNELVHAKSIARVGFHHDTSASEKRIENMTDIKMISEGKHALVDERRRLVESTAMEHARTDIQKTMESVEQKSLPMSEQEEKNGDPMYFIDQETGEKMYS